MEVIFLCYHMGIMEGNMRSFERVSSTIDVLVHRVRYLVSSTSPLFQGIHIALIKRCWKKVAYSYYVPSECRLLLTLNFDGSA